jgi:hypothetical protein
VRRLIGPPFRDRSGISCNKKYVRQLRASVTGLI